MKVADRDALDLKAFLLERYDGHCQTCATELRFSNGGKWVETFRIDPKEPTWADRSFNYGQGDPSGLEGLFKSWRSMGDGDQRSVTRKMPDIFSKFGTEAPLIMFKKQEANSLQDTSGLVDFLKAQGRLVVELSDIKGAQELYERMAQDLGFHTVEHLGVLEYKGQKPLTETEIARITYLLGGYASLLEPQECARFHGHPLFHGDYETVSRRIIRADGIVRRVYEDFTLLVSLPHYDETRNLFAADSKYSLEEVVARAISASRFAPYRSAMRDVQEAVKHRKHGLSAIGDESGSEASSSASLDQFRARIDRDVADVPSASRDAMWRVGMGPDEEAQIREQLAELRLGSRPSELIRESLHGQTGPSTFWDYVRIAMRLPNSEVDWI